MMGSISADVFKSPDSLSAAVALQSSEEEESDNSIVVGTIIGTILLYIPLAILCWWYDKKDKTRVRFFCKTISMFFVGN